jgi:DNA-binding response OmpR family regulator
MLTARGKTDDKVRGFDLGADTWLSRSSFRS